MKKERNGKDIDGEHRFEAVCFEAGLAIICEERFCLGDVNLCERHIKQLFQKFKVLKLLLFVCQVRGLTSGERLMVFSIK